MSTSRCKTSLVLALCLPVLALADFTPSAWKYRKRLPVDATKAITAVHVDKQVFSKAAPGLFDLRIVHGAEEVPYILNRMSASHQLHEIETELLDKGASGAGLQFVLSLGGVERHSRVTIKTNDSNFRRRVMVESSKDRNSWAVIRKEAFIFDFTHEGQHSSILSIEYPVSTQPYLRVTVEGWQDPAIVTGASVSLAEDRPPVRQVIQTFKAPQGTSDARIKAMLYTLDFGENNVPKDLLRFEILSAQPAMFHRAVEVETSGDGKNWAPHDRGVIFRVPGEESLWLNMADTGTRYLRVRLFHGDDKPLQIDAIVAESILRRLVFPSSSSGDYWLYYGNPDASRPSYDLPMVLARSSIESAAPIGANVEEPNPGYKPPPEPEKPFSDRNPALLYGALILAVLIIGYMTIRFIQKASAEASK
ncbi:hypothetical protein F183_A47990 [Bryobacterales bacterium F-183]|nr:hypothetical protein F183_A47990 [Bryobacterales bacterium F-183]